MDYLKIITEVIEELKKDEERLRFEDVPNYLIIEKTIARTMISIHSCIKKLDTIVKDLNYE